MLILYHKHNELLEDDSSSYLKVATSLSSSSVQPLKDTHTQVLKKLLGIGFLCVCVCVFLSIISLPSRISRGRSRSLPAGAACSYVYNGQMNNPFHSDGEYIYFNICIEDRNVAGIRCGVSYRNIRYNITLRLRFFYFKKL